jgi:hypothetical protein
MTEANDHNRFDCILKFALNPLPMSLPSYCYFLGTLQVDLKKKENHYLPIAFANFFFKFTFFGFSVHNCIILQLFFEFINYLDVNVYHWEEVLYNYVICLGHCGFTSMCLKLTNDI